MKKQFLFVALAVVVCSCSPTDRPEHFGVDPAATVKDFSTWWNYQYQNINLTQNYRPLDTTGREISKAAFLNQLSTGAFIAFRLPAPDTAAQYQLYEIPDYANKDIGSQMKQLGTIALARYKMEGTSLPGFHFTDLNGNIYNLETTKGKIVVIKCWFIHCQVCVEEMPALNQIVRQYKNRKDVVFISLAFDTPEQLRKFLTTNPFEYAVAPVSQEYLTQQLGVSTYPTQIILNKAGTIAKVFSNYQDLSPILQQEISR